MGKLLTAFILAICVPFSALADEPAPSQHDRAAIEKTALDYIEGWYTRGAARMERALHPKLIKRRVGFDEATGYEYLNETSGLELVQNTRPAPGEPAPPPLETRRRDVTILDVFGNAAVVKVDADEWVDYLQMVRWHGEWKILNVLWEYRPKR